MAESERVLAGSLLLTPVFRPIATQAPSSSVEWLCQSSKLAALMAALAPAMYTRLVEGL